MLRLQENSGWRLVTHPDHAALAGQFAECWGNSTFVSPEPRTDVLLAVTRHDDGWRGRDAAPQITRAGLPSAFSRELVGKYSAFEEIDLEDYLAVRRRAVAEMAVLNGYAAILISMHTYDLLTARADRSTIAPGDLSKLDGFLAEQRELQNALRAGIDAAGRLPPEQRSHAALQNHFRLLQACDNLSLLSCVDYPGEASLLHPLPVHGGNAERVRVERLETRTFRLTPSPFPEPELEFQLPARFVEGERFSSAAELGEKFAAASVELLPVRILS